MHGVEELVSYDSGKIDESEEQYDDFKEGQLFNKIEHSDYEEEIHQEDLEIVDADEKEEDWNKDEELSYEEPNEKRTLLLSKAHLTLDDYDEIVSGYQLYYLFSSQLISKYHKKVLIHIQLTFKRKPYLRTQINQARN